MGPAVNGDADDVPRRLETTTLQYASELITNTALEGLEAGIQQVAAPYQVLFLAGFAGRAGLADQGEDDGLLRRFGVA